MNFVETIKNAFSTESIQTPQNTDADGSPRMTESLSGALQYEDPTKIASVYAEIDRPWEKEHVLEARKVALTLSYARRLRRLVKSNVVGSNQLKLLVADEYTNRRWQEFTQDCTMHGWSWFELMTQLTDGLTVDGEILVQLVEDPNMTAPNRSPIKALVWDVTQIYSDLPQNITNRGRGESQGVIYDEYRRPTAYTVPRTATQPRKELPADTVIHIFERVFARQLRGIPELYFSKKALADADIFRTLVMDDAVMRAKLSIIFMIDEEIGDELVNDWLINNPETDADRQAIIQRYLQKALNIKPGEKIALSSAVEDIKVLQGTGIAGQDYALDHVEILRDGSAGEGISYNTLSGDRKGNYAALRHARMEDIAYYESQQRLLEEFIEQLYYTWVSSSQARNSNIRIDSPIRIIRPGFPPLDEELAANADARDLANGTKTRTMITAERFGLDWETEVLPTLRRESELMEGINPPMMPGNVAEPNGDRNAATD